MMKTRALASVAAVVLLLVLGVGLLYAVQAQTPGVSVPRPPATSIGRCSDGRPQSEIDFAGRMLWEPTASEISCVLNATVSGPGANRVYRLTDGRVLNLYERVEAVPVKPTISPLATGSADVNGATWAWSTLPAGPRQTLLLQGSLAGAPDIELYMELSDQAADLRLLRSIAASLRQLATSTPTARAGAPAVRVSATPTTTVTPRPGCGHIETGDIQACPGSGPIGVTLTVQGRSWSCTERGARVDLVFVGNQGEGIATGAVGGFSFPKIQPDANGDWSITVNIPAVLGDDHGRGGGPTTPGIYRIISKPAYCTADFTVTR